MDAYGYDIYTLLCCIFDKAVCHISVGFLLFI